MVLGAQNHNKTLWNLNFSHRHLMGRCLWRDQSGDTANAGGAACYRERLGLRRLGVRERPRKGDLNRDQRVRREEPCRSRLGWRGRRGAWLPSTLTPTLPSTPAHSPQHCPHPTHSPAPMGRAPCFSFQALLGIHFLQKTPSLWTGHPHLPSACKPAKWASDAAAVDEQEEGCQLRRHPRQQP